MKIKVQYVIDEQGLNDAVGLELVVLKESVAERWDGIHVVSKDDSKLMAGNRV